MMTTASTQPAMSIFDVLGPVMIGPSSSHTAGAARIGLMGRQILGEEPQAVVLHFYGSLAATYKGHMTDTAVIAGLLGLDVDDLRLPRALDLARERELEVSIRTQIHSERNPNTIEMDLRSVSGTRHVVGISVGGGEIHMTEIDDHRIRLDGKHDALLVFGDRQAAVTDRAANLLGTSLRFMETSSGAAAELITLVLHEPASPDVRSRIAQIPGVRLVREIRPLYDYGALDPQPLFGSVSEMLSLCTREHGSLPDLVVGYERKRSGLDASATRAKLREIWHVMDAGALEGLRGENRLVGGLMDGKDGQRLLTALREGRLVSGKILPLAIARAIAAMEVNAAMGKVVAAPTAGSCGVLPGALSAVAEERGSSEGDVVDALLVGAIYGVLIARVAPVSGALGGCQSEIGVASAMAAAALVQLGGGTPGQTAQAMALALKSVLGLACDPVAGPVEVPCIKRNAIGVANALAAADMALAGIESIIPPDEVILALRNVQTLLPMELRDTTLGGLGATPTAQRLKDEWVKRCACQP
jgi:L-serine dehydratase